MSSPASPQAVYRVISDLRSHLIWGGGGNPKSQHLLMLEAPDPPAVVGTEFTSVGYTSHGLWRDRSLVTEATPGSVFEFTTEGDMNAEHRIHGSWLHRYEIEPDGQGSRITYRCWWRLSEPMNGGGGHHLRRAVFFHILLPTIWERALSNISEMAAAQQG
jgi:hypothetical protein